MAFPHFRIRIVIVLLIIPTLILLGGCNTNPSPAINAPQETASVQATQNLLKFNNIQEVREFLLQRNSPSASRAASILKRAAMDMSASESAAPSSDSGTAIDYSKTNVQVQGVDEADFVKNDDRYIYMIAGNKLLI